MFKLDLEKEERPEIKLPVMAIHWIIKKARECQKKKKKPFISASMITLKPLTMWTTANYGKFLKRWEY